MKKNNDRRRDGKPEFKKDSSPRKYNPKRKKLSSKNRIVKTDAEKEGIRLNRYLANAGICSRREADKLIEAGTVSINNKVVTQLGTKVMPGDKVQYGGETLSREKLKYLVLNKPKDYITTTRDPQKRNTVLHLIRGACKERIYPVGRLDRNTTGVLLFTNDGDLAKKLTHPSHNVKKIYHVFLDKVLKPADMGKIKDGIELEDGLIEVDAISFIKGAKDKKEIGMELHSGRNRIVRRIFEHLGYKVVRLDRSFFAGLTKKDLTRGKWRLLSEAEVRNLKRIADNRK